MVHGAFWLLICILTLLRLAAGLLIQIAASRLRRIIRIFVIHIVIFVHNDVPFLAVALAYTVLIL